MRKKMIFIAIGLVLVLIIIIARLNKTIYKTEDRIQKIDNFISVEKEKAMAWVRVQGTNIDLPVMYYDDVEDLSDPTYDIAWSYTYDEKLPNKSTVFSHNVLNVSSHPLISNKNHKRFEQLMSYIYIDFVKENKYIQYTINNKNYLFKIYGVSFIRTDDLNFENSNISKKDLNQYIKDVKKNSYFKYDVDVNSNDKLLSLVTCTRFFGADDGYSFVVDARLLRENEKAKNYNVVENKSYNKIKKIMKGEKENA